MRGALFATLLVLGCSGTAVPPVGPNGAGACRPRRCEDVGAQCGMIEDGCGGVLDCGGCAAGEACGIGGHNRCGVALGCVPRACADVAAECGAIEDGCGNTLDCGQCLPNAVCGEVTKNLCGACVPSTCASLGAECGAADDGCGHALACGECGAGLSCGGGGVANLCGADGGSGLPTPATCTEPVGLAAIDPITGGLSRPSCDGASFCRLNPAVGNLLAAVWGTASDDVWAVGDHGVALHFDGQRWSRVPTPTTQGLTTVWGSARNDFWAAGAGGAVLRWDGTRWSQLAVSESGRFVGVRGSSADDVWLLALDGVLHYDGAHFDRYPLAFVPYSVVASAKNDAWIAGSTGCIHWDGARWSDPQRDCGTSSTQLWASSPSDVWAFSPGWGSSISFWSHFDGKGWTQSEGEASANAPALFGFSPRDLWRGGVEHFDGQRWTDVCSTAAGQESLWGPRPGELYGISAEQPRHMAGDRLSFYSAGQWHTQLSLRLPVISVAGHSGQHFLVTDDARRIAIDAKGQGTLLPSGTPYSLLRAFGPDPDHAFAIGGGTLLKWSGSDWVSAGLGRYPNTGWASSANDVWTITGNTTLDHFDGSRWTQVPFESGAYLNQLFGAGPGDLWQVGSAEASDNSGWDSLVIWHGDGFTERRVYEARSEELRGAAISSTASDVWVVSWSWDPARIRVLEWDGTKLVERGSFAGNYVSSCPIAASAPNDVWLACTTSAGTVFRHFDGTSWSERGTVPHAVDWLVLEGKTPIAAASDGAIFLGPGG